MKSERGTASSAAPADRVRRPRGGRKRLIATNLTLLGDLKALVEPTARGDPTAPLLWTAKSLRNPAAGLRGLGHRICHNVVADLLREMGYSLQANRKTREGTSHPDRDAQFGYINDRVKEALAAGEPAISVDTKKKELVGDFKNGGREYRPKGQPEPVRVHDFVITQLGRAAPYVDAIVLERTLAASTAILSAHGVLSPSMLASGASYHRGVLGDADGRNE